MQRHRQRLVKEGKLQPESEAAATPQGQQPGPGGSGGGGSGGGGAFEGSEQSFDVLSEVLQQQARLDDPHALRRKEFDRCVGGWVRRGGWVAGYCLLLFTGTCAAAAWHTGGDSCTSIPALTNNPTARAS